MNGAAPRKPTEAQRRRLLADCRVTYYRASGPGGQHRNKTETAVRLRHLPTGWIVTCARTRSQHRNRVLALERLWERLRERSRKPKPRKKTRVSAGAKARRVKEKKTHGQKKALRRPPSGDD